ncbi:MAG: excinuclease ABC subunit UvrB [Bdellovibrionota bacterium]
MSKNKGPSSASSTTSASEKLSGKFELVTSYSPAGDQPQAIAELTEGILRKEKHQVLLGVTGSGKTFTVASVVAKVNKPTLVMAPNKTLAAQLYSEFKALFPHNAVEYFVSYYDYYQPEAYVVSTDTFIEKDSAINDEIDKLRHSATRSLLERRDVLIVSSVSCIYGLGSPQEYLAMMAVFKHGQKIRRDDLLRKLIEINYARSDQDFHRGTFRVRGDVIDIFPAYESLRAIRIEMFGSEIESIHELDPLRGKKISKLERVALFPASHYVTNADDRKRAINSILEELRVRLVELKSLGKIAEAKRLESRTLFDIEMMQEVGYCPGVENYSRHMTGRNAGEAPPTLFDYFPKDFLLVADESHVTIPQVGGMYRGDMARKQVLVEHGFRLPSAMDNRPLKFEEFERGVNLALYVSATPSQYELEKAQGKITEQIIRPTGLLDPTMEIRPVKDQVKDLLDLARERVARNERVLVTTLTKRMAEDLSDYLRKNDVKVRYLHSDIETLERIEILKDLRLGKFDVLVGINLLREGLDLPEVSLVAILDADKEGFLRSKTSLIQTCGRAARNDRGHVVFFADKITRSLRETIDECTRRRQVQEEYNKKHGITPKTILKVDQNLVTDRLDLHDYLELSQAEAEIEGLKVAPEKIHEEMQRMEAEMKEAARKLEFERAADLRDKLLKLKEADIKWNLKIIK